MVLRGDFPFNTQTGSENHKAPYGTLNAPAERQAAVSQQQRCGQRNRVRCPPHTAPGSASRFNETRGVAVSKSLPLIFTLMQMNHDCDLQNAADERKIEDVRIKPDED